MRHTKRIFRQKLINSRWVVLVLTVLLVLPFAETKNHAEETIEVKTYRHAIEAHPVFLMAAPPQEKMPPRPLNVPFASTRQPLKKSDSPNNFQLPFAMSAAQAARIGNGLIEDADYQMALAYF